MAFQDRESLKRGFGSQPLYLLSALLSIDLFSRLSFSFCLPSHFSLSLFFFSLFLMFFDKSARGVRRRSSSKGTPWARKRKTSFNLRFSTTTTTTTSILCVYRADGLSVFVRPCRYMYILSPAGNLAPSDARLELHDRSIFPVASRTRYHRIRSDSRALGLTAFPPFWPSYLYLPFRARLLENA